jgi:transposase
MRRELTAGRARALLARIGPAEEVAVARLHIARGHLAGIRALDARLKYLAGQIAALAAGPGTTLMTLYGTGPLIAGRILAEAGDVARSATQDKFASCNGTAPIGVSSGDQVRHRLSRAGNRRNCHALPMMAVTQIRYPGTAGRRYCERKRKPLTPGRTTIQAAMPPAVGGFTALGGKDGRLAGIEVPGASRLLHSGLPKQAERTS